MPKIINLRYGSAFWCLSPALPLAGPTCKKTPKAAPSWQAAGGSLRDYWLTGGGLVPLLPAKSSFRWGLALWTSTQVQGHLTIGLKGGHSTTGCHGNPTRLPSLPLEQEWEGKEEHLSSACYEPGTMNRKKFIWAFPYKSHKEKDCTLFNKVQNMPTSWLNLGQSRLQRKLSSRGPAAWPHPPANLSDGRSLSGHRPFPPGTHLLSPGLLRESRVRDKRQNGGAICSTQTLCPGEATGQPTYSEISGAVLSLKRSLLSLSFTLL